MRFPLSQISWTEVMTSKGSSLYVAAAYMLWLVYQLVFGLYYYFLYKSAHYLDHVRQIQRI